jgi:hypothetical protein
VMIKSVKVYVDVRPCALQRGVWDWVLWLPYRTAYIKPPYTFGSRAAARRSAMRTVRRLGLDAVNVR